MRPGPPRGATANLEVTASVGASVSDDDPRVYATAKLAEDVERVCRDLLTPHLEAGEVAIGVRLELLHRAPVPEGETISLTATVASVRPTELTCEVIARHRGSIVARGSFEQRVVAAITFDAEIAARAAV